MVLYKANMVPASHEDASNLRKLALDLSDTVRLKKPNVQGNFVSVSGGCLLDRKARA